MKSFILFTAALLSSTVAFAQDNLEPEDSVFSQPRDDGYYAMVTKALGSIYSDGTHARAIVMPSFQPEYALAVHENNGKYKIIYREPEIQIWQFKTLEYYRNGEFRSYDLDGNPSSKETIARLEESLPDSIDDLDIKRCEIGIDAPLAQSINAVWRIMLLNTKYAEEPSTFHDGVTYHFSLTLRGRTLAGQTWSPVADSDTWKMVEITVLMREFCKRRDDETLARLEDSVAKFHAALASSDQ